MAERQPDDIDAMEAEIKRLTRQLRDAGVVLTDASQHCTHVQSRSDLTQTDAEVLREQCAKHKAEIAKLQAVAEAAKLHFEALDKYAASDGSDTAIANMAMRAEDRVRDRLAALKETGDDAASKGGNLK
jgi:chromosome segregation ATPase